MSEWPIQRSACERERERETATEGLVEGERRRVGLSVSPCAPGAVADPVKRGACGPQPLCLSPRANGHRHPRISGMRERWPRSRPLHSLYLTDTRTLTQGHPRRTLLTAALKRSVGRPLSPSGNSHRAPPCLRTSARDRIKAWFSILGPRPPAALDILPPEVCIH